MFKNVKFKRCFAKTSVKTRLKLFWFGFSHNKVSFPLYTSMKSLGSQKMGQFWEALSNMSSRFYVKLYRVEVFPTLFFTVSSGLISLRENDLNEEIEMVFEMIFQNNISYFGK